MIYYKLRQTSPSNESGFTIIESLVAILVAAILLAAIAPVIVISVATRVQAKRIETASDAAKTYIDGLSSKITTPDPTDPTVEVKLVEPPDPVPNSVDDISEVDPPALGLTSCDSNKYCSPPNKNLYCMDFDGGGCTTDSNKDLIIQAFRYGGTVTSGGTTTNITDETKGYQLGIRVYRANGFSNDGNLKKAPNKQATFTGGVGDRKTPLVEMTTEISNENTKFSDFCDRLEDTGNTASSCK
jgi:prepilin-type N-terminal cleavage/methylation domain-containing protein